MPSRERQTHWSPMEPLPVTRAFALARLSFAKTTSDSFNAPRSFHRSKTANCSEMHYQITGIPRPIGLRAVARSDGAPRRGNAEAKGRAVARAFDGKSTELDYAARLT